MTTIDQLLTKIVNSSSPTIEELIVKRDARVLRSLATAISSPSFITENQSRLLFKIIKDNEKKLSFLGEELTNSLALPTWSRVFRQVDQTKRMFIGKNSSDELTIVIEYAFSSSIRKSLSTIGKQTDGGIISINNRIHQCDLTEKNIVLLVDTLTPLDFEIHETLKNHYSTIKSWSENEIKNQYLLTSITNQNFHKQITNDLGISTPIDTNIIADRSIRYQYFVENTEKIPETLTEKIANRTSTRVWVDSTQFSVDDIVQSLVELKRFPILFVFDGFSPDGQTSKLHEIADCLDRFGIYDKVGMYFRLPNNPIGKDFNELISQRQYNCVLDKDTKVVGVQSGKIPKFFLNNEWKPMSVVSLNNVLRHSKTAVYANSCDLIISHTDTNPIIENTKIWQ
jgi:hypothetical protein